MTRNIIFVWLCWLYCIDTTGSQYAGRIPQNPRAFPQTFHPPAKWKAPVGVPSTVGASRRGRRVSYGRELTEKLREINELKQEAMELLGVHRRHLIHPRVRQIHHRAQNSVGTLPNSQNVPISPQSPQLQNQHLTREQRVSRKTNTNISRINRVRPPVYRNDVIRKPSLKGRADRLARVLRRLKHKRRIVQQAQSRPIPNITMAPRTMTKQEQTRGLNGVMEWIERIALMNITPASGRHQNGHGVRSVGVRNRQNGIRFNNSVRQGMEVTGRIPGGGGGGGGRYHHRRIPQQQIQLRYAQQTAGRQVGDVYNSQQMPPPIQHQNEYLQYPQETSRPRLDPIEIPPPQHQLRQHKEQPHPQASLSQQLQRQHQEQPHPQASLSQQQQPQHQEQPHPQAKLSQQLQRQHQEQPHPQATLSHQLQRQHQEQPHPHATLSQQQQRQHQEQPHPQVTLSQQQQPQHQEQPHPQATLSQQQQRQHQEHLHPQVTLSQQQQTNQYAQQEQRLQQNPVLQHQYLQQQHTKEIPVQQHQYPELSYPQVTLPREHNPQDIPIQEPHLQKTRATQYENQHPQTHQNKTPIEQQKDQNLQQQQPHEAPLHQHQQDRSIQQPQEPPFHQHQLDHNLREERHAQQQLSKNPEQQYANEKPHYPKQQQDTKKTLATQQQQTNEYLQLQNSTDKPSLHQQNMSLQPQNMSLQPQNMSLQPQNMSVQPKQHAPERSAQHEKQGRYLQPQNMSLQPKQHAPERSAQHEKQGRYLQQQNMSVQPKQHAPERSAQHEKQGRYLQPQNMSVQPKQHAPERSAQHEKQGRYLQQQNMSVQPKQHAPERSAQHEKQGRYLQQQNMSVQPKQHAPERSAQHEKQGRYLQQQNMSVQPKQHAPERSAQHEKQGRYLQQQNMSVQPKQHAPERSAQHEKQGRYLQQQNMSLQPKQHAPERSAQHEKQGQYLQQQNMSLQPKQHAPERSAQHEKQGRYLQQQENLQRTSVQQDQNQQIQPQHPMRVPFQKQNNHTQQKNPKRTLIKQHQQKLNLQHVSIQQQKYQRLLSKADVELQQPTIAGKRTPFGDASISTGRAKYEAVLYKNQQQRNQYIEKQYSQGLPVQQNQYPHKPLVKSQHKQQYLPKRKFYIHHHVQKQKKHRHHGLETQTEMQQKQRYIQHQKHKLHLQQGSLQQQNYQHHRLPTHPFVGEKHQQYLQQQKHNSYPQQAYLQQRQQYQPQPQPQQFIQGKYLYKKPKDCRQIIEKRRPIRHETTYSGIVKKQMIPANYALQGFRPGFRMGRNKMITKVFQDRPSFVYARTSSEENEPTIFNKYIMSKIAQVKASVKKPAYVKIYNRLYLVMPNKPGD